MSTRRAWIGGVALLGWALLWLWLSGSQVRPLWLLLGYLQTTGPHVLVAATTMLAAWAFGRPCRRRLVGDVAEDDTLTRVLLELTLGLTALIAVASLLASLGLLYPLVCRGLIGLGSFWGLFGLYQLGRESRAEQRPAGDRRALLLGVLATALLFPALLEIGAPPVGADEAQYHRRFIEQILRTGRPPADIEDGMTGFAMGMHVLGALPASFSGSGALRPFSLLLGVLGLLSGERLARRIFGTQATWIYILVVAGSVSLLRVLPTFNSDLVLSPFVALAVLLAVDWALAPDDPGGRPWAIAVLGGAALSIKFTAPLFLAPFYLALAGCILWRGTPSGRGSSLLKLAAAALIPLLFALPWLIKNQLMAGHPLYPVFGMSFPEGAATAFAFNFKDNYGPGSSVEATLRSPWDLFVLGREYDRRHFMGRLNLWPVIAIPGMLLVARRSRQALLLLLGTVGAFLLWAAVLRRVVYLTVLWPTLAALSAGGLAALLPPPGSRPRRLVAPALAVLLTASAVAELAPAWTDELEAASVAVGETSAEDYLDEILPIGGALRWLRDNTAPDETIALFWSWYIWDIPNRIVWAGAEDFTPLRKKLMDLETPEAVVAEMRRLDVRWVLHQPPFFLKGSYPSVSPRDFETAFVGPGQLTEQVVKDHLTLRFSHNSYEVYELPPLPPTTSQD